MLRIFRCGKLYEQVSRLLPVRQIAEFTKDGLNRDIREELRQMAPDFELHLKLLPLPELFAHRRAVAQNHWWMLQLDTSEVKPPRGSRRGVGLILVASDEAPRQPGSRVVLRASFRAASCLPCRWHHFPGGRGRQDVRKEAVHSNVAFGLGGGFHPGATHRDFALRGDEALPQQQGFVLLRFGYYLQEPVAEVAFWQRPLPGNRTFAAPVAWLRPRNKRRNGVDWRPFQRPCFFHVQGPIVRASEKFVAARLQPRHKYAAFRVPPHSK
mmetsp:Transcript_29757/g.81549  ORF Transcript_29757/g.81549 Transcript_29757/m.81549 type:complete len:268 (+) Transcript_29757:446-1249(+)